MATISKSVYSRTKRVQRLFVMPLNIFLRRMRMQYQGSSRFWIFRLAREMGVSFGGSRVIDEVTVDMVFSRLAGIGVSRIMAKGMLADMRDEVIPALKDAAQSLSEEGFPQVEDMLKGIMPGVERRLSVLI